MRGRLCPGEARWSGGVLTPAAPGARCGNSSARLTQRPADLSGRSSLLWSAALRFVAMGPFRHQVCVIRGEAAPVTSPGRT